MVILRFFLVINIGVSYLMNKIVGSLKDFAFELLSALSTEETKNHAPRRT